MPLVALHPENAKAVLIKRLFLLTGCFVSPLNCFPLTMARDDLAVGSAVRGDKVSVVHLYLFH